MSLPIWIKEEIENRRGISPLVHLLRKNRLHTVCEEARCPNIGKCFKSGTATFLILGNICTRNCRFCAINSGVPLPPDPDEPERVAITAEALGLEYVVITSVTRDDLPDGGASVFMETILKVRERIPDAGVEVLIPDFMGDMNALDKVLGAKPDVLNHNVETVPSLYRSIRPLADYERSLRVLEYAKKRGFITKSGIMVGLGESEREVEDVMKDLVSTGCDILTIGQYLRPSLKHTPVVEYIPPEKFAKYREMGLSLGIRYVVSGPLVRSSYMAKEAFKEVKHGG